MPVRPPPGRVPVSPHKQRPHASHKKEERSPLPRRSAAEGRERRGGRPRELATRGGGEKASRGSASVPMTRPSTRGGGEKAPRGSESVPIARPLTRGGGVPSGYHVDKRTNEVRKIKGSIGYELSKARSRSRKESRRKEKRRREEERTRAKGGAANGKKKGNIGRTEERSRQGGSTCRDRVRQ